ncbi:MAG: copper chaperone PCu(A)C [Nitrospirae bacterium]|nr:copper chaperone PCu(A)C [Nitrospirota bacterium]
MNTRRLTFIALICTIMLSCNIGGAPQISVKDAKLLPSQMMEGVASGSMQIMNDGKGADKLTGCSIKEFPEAHGMLHDFVEGKMTMIGEITVPAQKTTELKKGSMHLMFSNLPEKIESSEVTIILNFKKSGAIEVKTQMDL